MADHVTVISKAYGSDQAYMWQSDGADGYTVTECEKDTVGTDVIMHIKANVEDENYDQYLETYKLQELIKKYSDYIRYPIVMEVEDYRQKEKPADAGEDVYKRQHQNVGHAEVAQAPGQHGEDVDSGVGFGGTGNRVVGLEEAEVSVHRLGVLHHGVHAARLVDAEHGDDPVSYTHLV